MDLGVCKNVPLSDSGEPLRTTDAESDDEEEESNDEESSSDSEESENIQTEVITDNFEEYIFILTFYFHATTVPLILFDHPTHYLWTFSFHNTYKSKT